MQSEYSEYPLLLVLARPLRRCAAATGALAAQNANLTAEISARAAAHAALAAENARLVVENERLAAENERLAALSGQCEYSEDQSTQGILVSAPRTESDYSESDSVSVRLKPIQNAGLECVRGLST
jgi:hypothetical protein